MAVEQAPPPPAASGVAEEERSECLVTISAESPGSLRRLCEKLAKFLPSCEAPLRDISFVLNAGRATGPFREAFLVAGKEQLIEKLNADGITGCVTPTESIQEESFVVYLCSGDAVLPPAAADGLRRDFKCFRSAWDSCHAIARRTDLDQGLTERVHRLRFQYALHALWTSLGVKPAALIGTGTGHVVIDVISGRTRLDDGLRQLVAAAPDPAPPDDTKLRATLDFLRRKGLPVFVELGADGLLLRRLREEARALGKVAVYPTVGGAPGPSRSPLGLLAELYRHCVPIDWDQYYAGKPVRRVELPSRCFDLERYWVEIPHLDRPPEAPPAERKAQPVTAAGGEPNLGEARREGAWRLPAIEERLADIWRGVLKNPDVKPEDHYFELGGTSLTASQVINQIKDTFGTTIEFDVIYEHSTVKELARYLHCRLALSSCQPLAEVSQRPPLVRRHVHVAGPLSTAQQRMWFLSQVQPESFAYNMPVALRIRGPLDPAALQRSLHEVVRRHEILRTVIQLDQGTPLQRVIPDWRPCLPVQDLRGLPPADRPGELRRRLREEVRRTFDLAREPPVRCRVLRTDEADWVVVITMHHCACDEWSIGVLLEELSRLYLAESLGQPSPLPEPEFQYGDFAAWQRSWMTEQSLRPALDYWLRKLKDAPRTPVLPYDYPHAAEPSPQGRWEWIRLDQELTGGLNELSRREQASLFMTLLAAFQTLLLRYSGQEDILVGAPIANRTRTELEGIIGCFMNILVHRTDLSGNPPFHRLLAQVRRNTLEAYAHQDLPFDRLIDALKVERQSYRTPLIPVLLSLQNAPLPRLEIPRLSVEYLTLENRAIWYDLSLALWETTAGELVGVAAYDPSLFEGETIRGMVVNFRELLRQVVFAPETRIHDLCLVEGAEN
jgi:acyl carrier protein